MSLHPTDAKNPNCLPNTEETHHYLVKGYLITARLLGILGIFFGIFWKENEFLLSLPSFKRDALSSYPTFFLLSRKKVNVSSCCIGLPYW